MQQLAATSLQGIWRKGGGVLRVCTAQWLQQLCIVWYAHGGLSIVHPGLMTAFCTLSSAGPLVFLLLGLGAYFGYTRGSLSGKQAAKGRWVYDRSLGGKKVS